MNEPGRSAKIDSHRWESIFATASPSTCCKYLQQRRIRRQPPDRILSHQMRVPKWETIGRRKWLENKQLGKCVFSQVGKLRNNGGASPICPVSFDEKSRGEQGHTTRGSGGSESHEVGVECLGAGNRFETFAHDEVVEDHGRRVGAYPKLHPIEQDSIMHRLNIGRVSRMLANGTSHQTATLSDRSPKMICTTHWRTWLLSCR